jgi:hypothetical protein
MEIVYPTEPLLKSFHEALDRVAREQIYIEMIEAKSLEETTTFQKNLFLIIGLSFMPLKMA